jgi:hypothetical protein
LAERRATIDRYLRALEARRLPESTCADRPEQLKQLLDAVGRADPGGVRRVHPAVLRRAHGSSASRSAEADRQAYEHRGAGVAAMGGRAGMGPLLTCASGDRSARPVDVGTVVDPEDPDRPARIVDLVHDAVGPAPG